MAGERHLIIAGSNKCGTTSLFRYFGAHPKTSLSVTKEARFFYRDMHENVSTLRDRYVALFPEMDDSTDLCVEASPTYLHGGRQVAQNIHRVYPDALILVVLRDPAMRFVSFYKSKFGQIGSHVGDASFDTFTERAIKASMAHPDELDFAHRAALQELTIANYSDYLTDFIEIFGRNRVGVFFFEDMLAEPAEFMRSVCEFAGLDPAIYENFEFTVENRTRRHRSARVRRVATRLNERFEFLLNRWPPLRRSLRRVYDLANSKPNTSISIKGTSLNNVYNYYAEPNARLRDLMKANYPEKILPAWLV